MIHHLPKNALELSTPVGNFAVFDGTRRISFSIIQNPSNEAAEVYDTTGAMVGYIQTDNNYQLLIDPGPLEIGKKYVILFSAGEWEYCNSGQHAVCYFSLIDHWMVGIGAYDPNDDQKTEQAWHHSKQFGYLEKGFIQHPPVYDESSFSEYTVEPLADRCGFTFKLFDKAFDYVRFEAAWIHVDNNQINRYTNALGLWLS